MTRFCALAFLLVACNQGEMAIGPEPEAPVIAPELADAPDAAAPRPLPTVTETTPDAATVILLSPPPGAPTTTATDGWHKDACGYTRDQFEVGECKCGVIQCANGCARTASGAYGARSFCFDAGLPYVFRPR